ncbi:hypothetical protein FRC02_010068 [Tulasnella sp. 418]|nr:hypothetical protein FRC02_010068 [Tulasnella sp. 418]
MSDSSSQSDEGISHWKPILTLVVFLLTNIVVIFPFSIRVPIPFGRQHHSKRILRIPFNLVTVPPVSVLFLICAQIVNGTILRKGILGADGIKPIDIMALFISLAYIAISLDATGLLRFLAFYLLSKASPSSPTTFSSNNGTRLYFYLYILFFTTGVVVGNDPVILSGTAFLAYMTRVAGIVPPTAWIFAQFSVANIASTILVSSNPTNLVLTGAFHISFITYTLNVLLPSIASFVFLFPYLIYVPFNSPILIPKSIHPFSLSPESTEGPSEGQANISPISVLIDKAGAIFGTILLAITLAVLLATSAAGVHVEVWSITVPAAIIMLIRDMWYDLKNRHKHKVAQTGAEMDQPRSPVDGMELRDLTNIANGTPNDQSMATLTQEPANDLHRVNKGSSHIPDLQPTKQPAPSSLIARIHRQYTTLTETLPTPTIIFTRLPFPLIPFAFSMFILVQALGSPWISVFTSFWTAWVNKTGTVGAIVGCYVITVIGCNIFGTNIGATILFSRILQRWIQDHNPSSRMSKGAIYALAMGSNYGGAYSLMKQNGTHLT